MGRRPRICSAQLLYIDAVMRLRNLSFADLHFTCYGPFILSRLSTLVLELDQRSSTASPVKTALFTTSCRKSSLISNTIAIAALLPSVHRCELIRGVLHGDCLACMRTPRKRLIQFCSSEPSKFALRKSMLCSSRVGRRCMLLLGAGCWVLGAC